MISVSEAASLQLSPKAKFAWDKFLVKSFISTLPQEPWGKTKRRTLIVCQSQLCLPLRKTMINLDMINYDYCMINSAGSLDCQVKVCQSQSQDACHPLCRDVLVPSHGISTLWANTKGNVGHAGHEGHVGTGLHRNDMKRQPSPYANTLWLVCLNLYSFSSFVPCCILLYNTFSKQPVRECHKKPYPDVLLTLFKGTRGSHIRNRCLIGAV